MQPSVPSVKRPRRARGRARLPAAVARRPRGRARRGQHRRRDVRASCTTTTRRARPPSCCDAARRRRRPPRRSRRCRRRRRRVVAIGGHRRVRGASPASRSRAPSAPDSRARRHGQPRSRDAERLGSRAWRVQRSSDPTTSTPGSRLARVPRARQRVRRLRCAQYDAAVRASTRATPSRSANAGWIRYLAAAQLPSTDPRDAARRRRRSTVRPRRSRSTPSYADAHFFRGRARASSSTAMPRRRDADFQRFLVLGTDRTVRRRRRRAARRARASRGAGPTPPRRPSTDPRRGDPPWPQPPEPQTDASRSTARRSPPTAATIVMDLDPQLAPNTVNNFVGLARDGYYDGLTFHRVVPELRDPGRLPRGQRARRPRLQVRRRAGEGRVHARRGRDGERRSRHERLAVLHLHRRLHAASSPRTTTCSATWSRASTSPRRRRSAT